MPRGTHKGRSPNLERDGGSFVGPAYRMVTLPVGALDILRSRSTTKAIRTLTTQSKRSWLKEVIAQSGVSTPATTPR